MGVSLKLLFYQPKQYVFIKYSIFLESVCQTWNVYHVESVSFLQWDQTNVPDVQVKNPKDMKVMIPVVVDTAINSFFL